MDNQRAKKHKITQYKLAGNSWPFIENNNSWRFWIWKSNALLNGINNKPDIGKIYLYAKDPYEAKY